MEELYGGSPSPREDAPKYFAFVIPGGRLSSGAWVSTKCKIRTADGDYLSSNLLPLKYEMEGRLFDRKGNSVVFMGPKRKVLRLVNKLNTGKKIEDYTSLEFLPRRWVFVVALVIGFAFGTMVR